MQSAGHLLVMRMARAVNLNRGMGGALLYDDIVGVKLEHKTPPCRKVRFMRRDRTHIPCCWKIQSLSNCSHRR